MAMASKRRRRKESTTTMSDYEKMRLQRIKENKEKLEKMGILTLANNLKPPTTKPKRLPPSTSLTRRRSSRLTAAERVDYSENSLKNAQYVLIPMPEKDKRGSVRVPKSNKGRKHSDVCIKQNSNPEVYTEEHQRLLGDCKTVWDLDVDGFDEDGHRIYDQFQGKHCHQCRQKTLGHHTECSNCKAVEGQFCGDCLFTRYGENVVEANEDSSWTCPICRGICNCSRCRRAKGWEPTGDIYSKVKWQGFKSVAHYLIETRMEHKIEDPTPEYGLQVSADGESKPIDGEPSQSNHNSVLEISDDNKHGGTDEEYNATDSDSHDSSGDESEDS
ncbi:Cell division cycle-associated 7-like protein [Heracleum sosnowskyi]|uniref:Cell division cycle-associated 7-like protein n=1 Tax=Heracleum sosnowskyi TaxID=360622 RepID=A0AAD8MEB6_9APIA|nr:Cell division cycle-associated 7-like protein [Heracleum sosnowskyi]